MPKFKLNFFAIFAKKAHCVLHGLKKPFPNQKLEFLTSAN